MNLIKMISICQILMILNDCIVRRNNKVEKKKKYRHEKWSEGHDLM